MEVDGYDKLIARMKPGDETVKFYAHIGELWDVLKEIHENNGHAGRDKMVYTAQTGRYKGITAWVCQLYKNHCMVCLLKEPAVNKGVTVKPMVFKELNSRAQVYLIDLQSTPDGEYKFIMNLQDHLTKFLHLRPLKNKEAVTVARELLPIFLEFGAPPVLAEVSGFS